MPAGYEGLDRAGGFSRVRLLAPLAHRDYRLLLAGTLVSLIGDGVFLVALAWQVYTLSDAPTAMGSVGIAMAVPTIVCLLLGGAVSDRYDRRLVMLVCDVGRALLLGLLALLAATGQLALWHLLGIAVLYGVATAFFDPASDSLVPQLLGGENLAQANSLDQLVRPLALRLLGPALGGVFVGAAGTPVAFGLDGVTFAVSALSLVFISPVRATGAALAGSMGSEVVAGLRYVRGHAWLWATLVSAAIAYLLFLGPTEVLLPFIVKNSLHAGAQDLGIVYGAGGVGSLICAVTFGQRGMPRRPMVFIYLVWGVATVAVAGYGIARGLAGLVVASVVFNSLETAGTIAWATVKQRTVPATLLGRVSSLDWLISIGLLPVSYALTGPASAALGARPTMILAGVIGAAVTFAPLLLRSARRFEIAPEPGEVAAGAAEVAAVAAGVAQAVRRGGLTLEPPGAVAGPEPPPLRLVAR